MLFSELYSVYYQAVAAILQEALLSDLTDARIAEIAKEYAFGESFLTIEKSLKSGVWPLLRSDRSPVLQSLPSLPLTVLQKRWLKAIAQDPRMQLFDCALPSFEDVEPLFMPEDICIFDAYADGDRYSDEGYRQRFRMILDAIKRRYPLKFNVTDRDGKNRYFVAQPEHLEYSEKDDKFRLITSGCRFGETINLGRIVSCKPSELSVSAETREKKRQCERVVLLLTDERNALDRVLLHFAHFAKEAERIDTKHYKVTVEYDADDETEMVIRILSFGPMLKVLSPDHMINRIKQRLLQQKSCGLS